MICGLKARVQNFLFDDSGAVTVDWVVLTAVAVAMAIAAVSALGDPNNPRGIYTWLYYSEFMLGEYVPNTLGFTCGYFGSYFDSDC